MPPPSLPPLPAVILTRAPRLCRWLPSTRMPTAVPTRKRPGKLEKDIRWECFNPPDCPDLPAGRTSTVRRRRILTAQHSIVVVLAM